MAGMLRRLEELLHRACRVAGSLLPPPGEEGRFAAANEHLGAQVQDTLGALHEGQSRKQL